MNLFFLQTHWVVAIIGVGILGLIIGSFLNVVIIRYPVMLMQAWRKECVTFLKIADEPEKPADNLIKPRSHCLQCGHALKWFQNIPLISYITLRGRCGYCGTRISAQYWVVELLTAIVTVIVFFKYGISWQTVATWVFSWILITLGGIDWRNKILPDAITLAGLWIGLIVSTQQLFITPVQAIGGAFGGYIFFWIIANLFAKIRRKPGLGYGDFKLLAFLGAWLGPLPLIYVVFLAAVFSLLAAIFLLVRKKIVYDHPLPFGPSLALAGWLTFMFASYFSRWLLF